MKEYIYQMFLAGLFVAGLIILIISSTILYRDKLKNQKSENILQEQKQNCKPKQFEMFGKTYQFDFFKECE